MVSFRENASEISSATEHRANQRPASEEAACVVKAYAQCFSSSSQYL